MRVEGVGRAGGHKCWAGSNNMGMYSCGDSRSDCCSCDTGTLIVAGTIIFAGIVADTVIVTDAGICSDTVIVTHGLEIMTC